ncbi:MAG: hypothetical protein R6X32_10065 [Chloroflexota bacterium]|jgi:hypothetical protein
MKPITQHIYGSLLTEGTETAVLLQDTQTATPTADSLYLRFAFVIRGPEQPVFPALALDDWGGEIRGLALYQWVREYGEQFPRAELFGYDLDGSKTQVFLRALELYARLPCYVYRQAAEPLTAGRLVSAILLPTDQTGQPVRLPHAPPEIKRPLRAARVSWWQLPLQTGQFDFSLLVQPSDPGF